MVQARALQHIADAELEVNEEGYREAPRGRGAHELAMSPELVVQQSNGATLVLRGELGAYQQEDVLEVTSIGVCGKASVVMRAFFSESGKDSAVLLETALRLPVALLHTGTAVGPKGSKLEAAANRRVLISRAAAFEELGPYDDAAHFAEARAIHTHTVAVLQRSAEGHKVLLMVHRTSNASKMSISDKSGTLVASVEPTGIISAGTTKPILMVNVRHEADCAMVLAAIIAAVKLS